MTLPSAWGSHWLALTGRDGCAERRGACNEKKKKRRKPHTVLLLNVSMTLSPPSRETNTISAMRKGFVLTILQLTISPPTGVMALSISAAVVPGAKFWPRRAYGPARPRMVRPLPDVAWNEGVTTLTWSVSILSTAATSLALRLAALLVAVLPFLAPGTVMWELREPPLAGTPLTESWRSCVHSPLTLPAGKLVLRVLEAAAAAAAAAGVRCYTVKERCISKSWFQIFAAMVTCITGV